MTLADTNKRETYNIFTLQEVTLSINGIIVFPKTMADLVFGFYRDKGSPISEIFDTISEEIDNASKTDLMFNTKAEYDTWYANPENQAKALDRPVYILNE